MKKIALFCVFTLASLISFSQKTSENSEVKLQREAQFPGGEEALIKYIYENIKWPDDIKGNIIDDVSVISFDVRPDSLIENIVYLKKVGYFIDEQIAELLKRKKFIPSIQNNIPVKMNIIVNIPIQYRKK